ncbi:alanine racemase, partial [Salmonella enterica subsp. enterica serovar Rissen]|nr:alanine racemase [Salmonella enterica subsp. enterica serovar Rissen]
MSNSLSLPTLVCQQVHTLAQQQSQPLCAYVYDLSALEEHIKQLRHVLPRNVELFYAAKANPSGPILKTLAPYVDGFEAASGGELVHLHQQQLDKPLIFGGPGKMPSELQQAIELDVDAIHVESLTELQRIGALTERL